jgi:hypothetical protein
MPQFSVFSAQLFVFIKKKRALRRPDRYFVKRTPWQALMPGRGCDLVATHIFALLTASWVFALRSRLLAVLPLPVPTEN